MVEVIIGKDDYLFLSGGQHHVFEFFTGQRPVRPESVSHFADNVAARKQWADRARLQFCQIVCPDKIFALKDKLAGQYELFSVYEQYYAKELQKHHLQVIYPIDFFSGNEAAFLKTDTHYSVVGSEYIARLICAHMLKTPLDEPLVDFNKALGEQHGFIGDLGNKLEPQRSETRQIFHAGNFGVEKAESGLIHGNDGIIDLYYNETAEEDGTIVVFGDSFARLAMPFLAVRFKKAAFLRTRFMHHEVIDVLKPKYVVCASTERYFSSVSLDLDAPNFFTYPLYRGLETRPTQNFGRIFSLMAV